MDTSQMSSPSNPSEHPGTRFTRDINQPHKACDACKRRKVRCSGTNPCDHCRRNHSSCVYSSRHGRLAYLERRLQQSEKHIRALELAWKRYLPDVDLTQAVQTVESESRVSMAPNSTDAIDTRAERSSVKESTHRDISPPNLEVGAAETLEWDESLDLTSSTDGIGSLSIHNKVSGYMGPQSGNALLRYLQSIKNFISRDSSDIDYAPLSTSAADSPEVDSKVMSTAFRNQCLDWYFLHYHKAYPLLHEGYFRGQCMGAVSKPKDGSWPVLYNMVLALGAFSGPESSSGTDLHFFSVAHSALSIDILHRGSIHLVQAFALLANYLQKRNKPNTGFTFIGIALNIAQGLGLHREFTEDSMSPFAMEIRRRVWWTLYIFDSGARLTFGRSTVLLGGNLGLPHNIDDGHIAVDTDRIEDFNQSPTTASCLIWQCKLAEISNEVNSKLLENRIPSEGTVMSLDGRISAWYECLPVYFKEDLEPSFSWFDIPRKILLWRAQHLRIVLTRPYLLKILQGRYPLDVSSPNAPVGRCLLAAKDCADSITSFCTLQETIPGGFAWYSTYWLVTAILVITTCLLYDPDHSEAHLWRTQVEKAQTTLSALSTVEPIAERANRILAMLMDLVPPGPNKDINSVNEQMRMEIADIWSESWLDMDHVTADFMPSIMDDI